MAGELRVYRYLTIIKDGVLQLAHGSIESAMTAVSVNAAKVRKAVFSVAASGTETVWSYSAGTDAKVIVLESTGYADVSLKVQKPTSASDKTPTGTPLYIKMSVSSYAPLILNADALFNASQANYNASHFGGAGNEAGYIYEVAVKNPSATSAVTVTVATTD